MTRAAQFVSYGEIPVDGSSEAVAYTGTAGTSAAMPANTSVVRVTLTTNGFISFGTAPTAVADGTDVFMAAGVIEYFPLPAGHKVSAIQSASAGTMYVTPMA